MDNLKETKEDDFFITDNLPSEEPNELEVDIDELFNFTYTKNLRSVEDARAILEDAVVTAIIKLLGEDNPAVVLKAVQEAVSLIGLKEKAAQALRDEEKEHPKVEKNSNISEALIKSLTGISNVTEGTANEIKTQKGGKGA